MELGAMQPEGFPDASFDAVTINRGANRARHGEANPPAGSCFLGRPSEAKRRKQWTGEADTMVIDLAEIGGA
jgi:hypothetical protein